MSICLKFYTLKIGTYRMGGVTVIWKNRLQTQIYLVLQRIRISDIDAVYFGKISNKVSE